MENKPTLTLGAKIRLLRELKGMKQEQIAKELGMTQNGYGKIERDETDVPYSRLEKIAKALKVSVSELTSIDEEKLIYAIHNSNIAAIQHQGGFFVNYTAEKSLYEQKIESLERENVLLRELNETLKKIYPQS